MAMYGGSSGGGGRGEGVGEVALQADHFGTQLGVLFAQRQQLALEHQVVDSPLLARALGGLVVLATLVPVHVVLLAGRRHLPLAPTRHQVAPEGSQAQQPLGQEGLAGQGEEPLWNGRVLLTPAPLHSGRWQRHICQVTSAARWGTHGQKVRVRNKNKLLKQIFNVSC